MLFVMLLYLNMAKPEESYGKPINPFKPLTILILQDSKAKRMNQTKNKVTELEPCQVVIGGDS